MIKVEKGFKKIAKKNLSMRVLLSAVRPEKAQAIFSEEGRGDMVGVRRFGW